MEDIKQYVQKELFQFHRERIKILFNFSIRKLMVEKCVSLDYKIKFVITTNYQKTNNHDFPNYYLFEVMPHYKRHKNFSLFMAKNLLLFCI